MISFEDLTLENWDKFKESILNSELVFKKLLRSSEEQFLEVLATGGFVAKVMKLDGEYVGNIVGSDVTHEKFIDDSGKRSYLEKTILVYNIVIDAAYQNKGYGERLLEEFITESRGKGYKMVVGYFRPNGSLSLIKKMGGKEMGINKNWYESGEDYTYCELKLQ